MPSALTMMPFVAGSMVSVRRITPASILIGAATFLLALNLRRVLWPNSSPDPAFSEPLPPGGLGCPLLGHRFFAGSDEFGTGYFYHKMSKKLGGPSLWKFYFLGQGRVVVSGGENLREVLSREFETPGLTNGASILGGDLFGAEGILFESDRDRHGSLRRLIGAALTPAAIAEATPNLQRAAERQARKIASASSPVRMDEICADFTLDVAWRQILGLHLEGGQILAFKDAVEEWIRGMGSTSSILRLGVKRTRAYKAKLYLSSLIEEKIQNLERNGPDSSTLSGMVFASDEEQSSRRLTRQQVIDNSLFLILAGSETSASTLTNAILLLGLHPFVWEKLVKEQCETFVKHGAEIQKEIIDEECPYLDAVIKEAMRIKPFTGLAPRIVTGTITLSGKQIPKGWGLFSIPLLTHELDPITYKDDWSHMDIRRGFVPERWLQEGTRPSSDFVPMGAGPRYCLGSHLAYTEMKVFLAVLARTIHFELSGDTENINWKKISFVPKPLDGVPVVGKFKGRTTQA